MEKFEDVIRKYETICVEALEEMGATLPKYQFEAADDLGSQLGVIKRDADIPTIRLNKILFREGADKKPLLGTIGRMLLLISDANSYEPAEKFVMVYGLGQAEWNISKKANELSRLGVPANYFWDFDYIAGEEEKVVDVECRCQHHLIVPNGEEELTVTCPFCKQEIEMEKGIAVYPGKGWRFMVEDYEPDCNAI